MKQFNFSNVISSVILGIAIIIGCFIFKGDHEKAKANEIINSNKPLMTIQETADYLNLSEFQVKTIISSEESMLKASGSYSGMMFPIIKIGNDIYVSANGLNDWLKESTQQRKQY
ncbi:helix-turn-helix domain-containing protein [Cohnella silvisoli]|uniref:Helix-turn-helix domain-containing protein n=1 Tax=Cohnella silvisoli TaxID=2873699 RepID=A0ABV1L1L1_9BACL|nr:helix-turn-helix domain-containing protein [Cohnella silvisoli]MCD9025438.1 helix-turn-helix domain-containing protein [Cohnella silvisoli]